jgi:hypothetical protein
MKRYWIAFLFTFFFVLGAVAQTEVENPPQTEKAEAVVARAIEALGGERYLQVTSQISRGKFTQMRDGSVISFQSFVDVIVFPDKERTEFRGGGNRVIQVNTGDTGWLFDSELESIKTQTPVQVEAFKRGIRTSIDNLLRGKWKGSATLAYIGRRPATLGKRNEAIALRYEDGFSVEFEFAVDDGLPQKALFKRENADAETITEEDRYAQFIENYGIKTPFVVDRFVNGKQTSRINFESIEFNKRIPDTIFTKPANIKDAKREMKL